MRRETESIVGSAIGLFPFETSPDLGSLRMTTGNFVLVVPLACGKQRSRVSWQPRAQLGAALGKATK